MARPKSTSPEHRPALRDRDVRAALHRKVLADHHDHPDTLVLDELGLEHGACRVDIAVVNGQIHGYEIKSEADTLERLTAQAEVYSRSLDRVTLVVGERHADHIGGMVPDWWAVRVVEVGPRGGIHFQPTQEGRPNPAPDLMSMAHLLWRPEAMSLLLELGLPDFQLRKNRATLYRMLVDYMEPDDLRRHIRECLKSRQSWRRHPQPS